MDRTGKDLGIGLLLMFPGELGPPVNGRGDEVGNWALLSGTFIGTVWPVYDCQSFECGWVMSLKFFYAEG